LTPRGRGETARLDFNSQGGLMPVYVCRWLNGDCSFVSAPTKESAIQRLDENAGNAEGCPIQRIERFQIHFKLTDDGRLELEEEGIWTWNSVAVEPDLYDIADRIPHSARRSFSNFRRNRQRPVHARAAGANQAGRTTGAHARQGEICSTASYRSR
jgi:hypothetical protein